MTAQREHAEVLIVGAGPSGLVSALLLARLGIPSIVIERNVKTDEHPKAHELNARSVEILRDAGIGESEIAQEASPLEDGSRILFCREINEEFGRIDLMADPARKAKYAEHLRQDLPYFNLSQSEFEKILVRHAETSPLIDLRFRHQWKTVVRNDDCVVSRIVDDASGREFEIEAGYLLACDGASSPVRRALGIGVEGPAEIQNFINAYFQMNLRGRVKTPAKLYWCLHPRYAGTFISHHMEKRWVYAIPYYKPWQKPEDFTPEMLKERIQGALGFPVPDLEITSISPWRMTAQVADSYRSGRVFLVGDAAHRFPPTGGLGMNTGIADAHNLCWKLRAVARGQADDTLLDTYETERRPIAVKNCKESRDNFDRIFEVFDLLGIDANGMELLARVMNSFPVKFFPEGLKRAFLAIVSRPVDRKIRRVFHDRELKERLDRAVANQIPHFDRLGLDIGYTYEHGALIDDGTPVDTAEDAVTQYVPSTHPGARLPHRWVETSQGRKSTHDFLAYDRFTLFAQGAEWRPEAENMGEDVQFVDISTWNVHLDPESRPLLVRPDGHVAWRGNQNKVTPLEPILNGITGNVREKSAGTAANI